MKAQGVPVSTTVDLDAMVDRLGRWSGTVPAGYVADFLGILTRTAFWRPLATAQTQAARHEAPPPPAADEEIFEWIDLFEAVAEARGTFRMIELGAGYGRWSLRGHVVASRLGLNALSTAVEADAEHFGMLQQHLADNAAPAGAFRLVQAAVAGQAGAARFYTGHASDWYGQALTRRTDAALADQPEAKIVTVPTLTLAELIPERAVIDLVDFDIQGAELEVVRASIDTLSRQVRRVHVGTHPGNVAGLEEALRGIFETAGWRPRWDFAGLGVRATPVGEITFQDGVQTWINPRLAGDAS